jgi:alkylation response protein AidB-like acyl-CoA dehydrogenase
MMFHLSDEQEQLHEAVRQFAIERGDLGARRAAFESDDGFDAPFWSGMMSLGLGGVGIPAAYGGMGLEIIDLVVAAEALGFAAAPGPFLGHTLAGLAIAWYGSELQKRRWLPLLAAGDAIGTIALADHPNAWRGRDWETQWDSGFLQGTKDYVPYPALADVVIVGIAGGGLALIERGACGISIYSLNVADRTRRVADVRFERTPAELLPGSAAGSDLILSAGLVLLAADACGGANYLLDLCVNYARSRRQFGGPIGRFQGLKYQLADMAVRVEPVRSLCWYAAHALDHVPEERVRVACLAKAHAAECFMQVGRDAIEAHGGIGYTWEYDAQLWFKRAMFDYAYLGSPAVQRAHAADLAGW